MNIEVLNNLMRIYSFNSSYNQSKINATMQTTILRWGSTKQLDCSTATPLIKAKFWSWPWLFINLNLLS